MLTLKEKEEKNIITKETKGIFKDVLINDIANLTNENIESITKIISNYDSKTEDPALLIALSHQGLILTEKNLSSVNTIFQIIDKKNPPSILNNCNFKEIFNLIDKIHLNGKIFQNITYKYLENNNDYKDNKILFKLKPDIFNELEKNNFITTRWSQISNLLNKTSYITQSDIKLLISNTTKILKRITLFIEKLKEGLEKITTHIKTSIENKIKGEKLKFIKNKDKITKQILERSNLNVLSQIIKLNKTTYFLLN